MEWRNQLEGFPTRLSTPFKQITAKSQMAKDLLLDRVGVASIEELDAFWAEVKGGIQVVRAEEEWQLIRERFEADAQLTGVVSIDFEQCLEAETATGPAPATAEPEKKQEKKKKKKGGNKNEAKTEAKTGLENVTLLLAGTLGEGGNPNLVIFDLRESKNLPETFLQLIENQNILKVGSGIKSEIREAFLSKFSPILDTTRESAWAKLREALPGARAQSGTGFDAIALALFGFTYKPTNDQGRQLYVWKSPLSDGQLTYLRNDMLLPLVFVLKPVLAGGEGESLQQAIMNFWGPLC